MSSPCKPIYALILLSIALLSAQNAHAQQTTVLSPSVVLVLKLVSATHVRPTTGIVISDTGLVLVPADFVTTDSTGTTSEIVVLDGGTDILSNGRPAIVVNRSIGPGVAVLSVEGLRRPGIMFSEGEPDQQQKLHLEAFPPAEYIAKGAEPLWVTVSPETALPYVSGPIIDECGYLAGLSLAQGTQRLEADTQPEIIPAAELQRTLVSMRYAVSGANCSARLPLTDASAAADEIADEAAKTSPPETPAPAGDADSTGSQQTDNPESSVDSAQEAPVMQTRPPVSENHTPPSLWRSVPWWVPLLALIVLAVSGWKAHLYYRLHKNKGAAIAADKLTIQPASDEPDTALLGTGADAVSAKPRSAPNDEVEIPDVNALPDGYSGILILEGLFDSDTIFKRYCLVNPDQAEVVIGRGEVDINIEHPAISRNHARIELDAGSMTLSDSGSNNGTYINGIPCLPGEVMYIDPADDIFLGGVRARLRLTTSEASVT